MTAGAAPQLRAQRRRYGEDVVKVLLGACALISILTTVGIVIALFVPAFEFFQEVPITDFLTGKDWSPLFEPAHFGVLPLVAGTLLVTGIASLVAMPLGLGSAIYLSEYASPRVRGILKPAFEILAGIPTIVFGYFALTFMTPLLRDIGIQVDIFNTLSAALVMGVMLMPTVASLSEDAMGAVPRDLREGAYALGVDQGAGGDPHRGARGRLGHHRLVRACDLARRRRDDDRADRDGPAAQSHLRPA